MRVWDPVTGKLMLSFLDHPFPMTTIAWKPDGKTLAAGSEGGTIVIYDATAGFEATETNNSSP